jgi:type II secretory pathway pseudopilin PulG
VAEPLRGQTLINIDFGVGTGNVKMGFAATGLRTNDYWNLYGHYDPKFVPGMPLVANGKLDKLKFADGTPSEASVTVANAPGVWGNSSGDPMYDTYMFAQNGSNIVVTLTGLPAGRYHFYLYGHADPDVTGEQNSVFTLKAGTNTPGPIPQLGSNGWKATGNWQERAQYVVFRDVPVESTPVIVEVAPGPNGVAVLNGLQILSRGTGSPRLLATMTPDYVPVTTNLLFRDIRYEGEVSDTQARFTVSFEVESMTTNEISAPVFEGDVALVSPALPEPLRIISRGRQFVLYCARPGTYSVKLDLVAKITRAEPWNQVSFTGPPAAMASISAKAKAEGVEMQLLSGTQLEPDRKATSRLNGFLGFDQNVTMRWQSKAAEVTRKSLVTAETTASVQIAPTVMKFITGLKYDILQAAIPQLTIELPLTHALTKIQGEQIRDWQVKTEGQRQVLTVEFIKPVEKSCAVTLFSEQSIENTPVTVELIPPRPLDIEHESGAFTLSAEDTTVEIGSTSGLRQVNPPAGALAAYRFNGRPVSVHATVRRIEPVLKLADRVTARLEETRFVLNHRLELSVEKAGIYALELTPQPGFTVTEVKGEGVEDWKTAEGKLKISFSAKVLGARKIEIQLEETDKEFPERITVLPLAVAGATNVTTQLGAGSSPGIRLKTAELDNLREVPIASLPNRGDELLAFVSEQPVWKLVLSVEKLPARVVAEVFNLVTIGDGLVGGSATIRFGIINQGVQQFRIALPAHWRNVDFTGANIRRKEQQTNTWTITLQDKAWGGYTLVITYDYQFEPKGSSLDLAGAHPLDVERETGALGIMTAASLKLTPAAPIEPLRRIDEAELPPTDRALCTRPLLLAYKYTGSSYQQTVQVTRFEEVPVLDAVADRIELTTVLTEEGQLLTQSSFMVKNNDKQFQRFKLPDKAEFWSSYVNGEPAKPERDGDWLLVPLPRDANRDQAFAVDIVHAQKIDLKASLFPHRLKLAAPLTDIPNTYAEWQLFVPVSQRLSRFDGNMTVARGTTYDLRDAWREFVQFYGMLVERHFGALVACFLAAVVLVLLFAAVRRGARGALGVVVVFAVLAVLAAMMLPALSRAKARAQRVSAVNNLKQIGLAAKIWAQDNSNALPPDFDAMKDELGTDKITIDPNTGQRFVYAGAGKSDASPEAIVAYSPSDNGGRAVLFADGSVQVLSGEKFQEALRRDAVVPRAVISANVPATVDIASLGVQPTPLPDQQAQPPPALVEQSAGQSLAMSAPQSESSVRMARRVAAPSPTLGGAGGSGGGLALGLPQGVATATGVRPIRIDVPRSGQAFSFTKILNAGKEPLTISASVMGLRAWRNLQMVLQVTAFLFGLAVLLLQFVRPVRSSLWMAISATLILWSVANLLMMWRRLHVGLILTVPLLLLVLSIWVAYRIWQHRKARVSAEEPAVAPATPPPAAGADPASAVSLIAFLFLLPTAALRADQATPGLTNTVSVVSAVYTGSVNDKVAQFDTTIQISTTSTNQIVPLFGEEVAIQSFTAKGGARLVREGRAVGVLLPARTNVTLQFKLIAKLGGDVSRRKLAFAVPPALSSTVTIVIDEPDADVDFPTAVAFDRSRSGQQTRVEGVLGTAERLELNWTPRVKRAAEIVATIFVQNTTVVKLGGGVMNTRTRLDYQITQGETRQLQVQIPSGHRLLRVEGESLRTWDVKGDTLVVELGKGVSPTYSLLLETEKTLESPPVTTRIEIPHALEVKRETGLLGVHATEELSVTVETASELQRIDGEEFARAMPENKEGLLSAFRFFRTDFGLSVKAEPVQAQVEAVARNNVRIGSESAHVAAHLDYVIKRAGLFALRVALPAGYRLESVAGTNISQWVERTENGNRRLDVTLKERTLGAYALSLVLTRNYREPPVTLPIVGVHPLGVQKLSGFITVTTEQGVAAKTGSFEGLTEIPVAAAGQPQASPGAAPPLQGSALAYKFVSTTPGDQPGWSLAVTTEAVEPWVRAEVVNLISVTETLLSGRTLVKYEVANAPIKEFRVRVPGAFKNVDISGAQIRRRDETNGEWRVELQSKVRGDYVLTVSWELPKGNQTNVVSLGGVQALGVEREAGFVAVIAKPPLQVSDQSAVEGLSRIDVRELPSWAGRPDAATVLAYRYLRPGYTVMLDARRYAEAEVLEALIDTARLSTVVADDGQMMTEVSLSIRNNGRQHLEIELPEKTTVWSAFVAGEPVRPSKREGKLLLPLTREIASEAPLAIEFTFIGAEKFPRHHGTVALASPKFDLPLKNARWDLYLPPDYEYDRFQGSMNRTSDTVTPVVQTYSLSEYNVQQQTQEAQKKMEMRYGLEEARGNLASGKLREAVSFLNRSKAKGERFAETDASKDYKQVEDQLRRAQSSNLIAAQNDYFVQNAARLGDLTVQARIEQNLAGRPAQVPQEAEAAGAFLKYDADVAGQQWDKLARAQQVAVTRVAPLRVNLPTRGVHLSFAQVLQTELRKPMTIRLDAENTRVPSWTSRIGLSVAGFLVLWGVIAALNQRRASTPPA